MTLVAQMRDRRGNFDAGEAPKKLLRLGTDDAYIYLGVS